MQTCVEMSARTETSAEICIISRGNLRAAGENFVLSSGGISRVRWLAAELPNRPFLIMNEAGNTPVKSITHAFSNNRKFYNGIVPVPDNQRRMFG